VTGLFVTAGESLEKWIQKAKAIWRNRM